jgi:hypothetical protein
LSIDEAGTHVGVRRFRLLVGVYDADNNELLGTGISAAIRVLANNDVPSGAAYIVLNVPIRSFHLLLNFSNPSRLLKSFSHETHVSCDYCMD